MSTDRHPVFWDLGNALINDVVDAGASPIERKMFAGLILAAGMAYTETVAIGVSWSRFHDEKNGAVALDMLASHGLCEGMHPGEVWLLSCGLLTLSQDWHIWRQLPIDEYRADFALMSMSGRIVIECDGHDFHERTKEQAARDRRRDRRMSADGWGVMRFTGSEIHADPVKCGREVIARLMRLDEALFASLATLNRGK